MAGTYIYDPSKLGENGKDKMRFELGDTLVDGGEITSPLCDEEYYAILDSTDSWRKAKYELLRAIAMKLSFQADSTSIDGLSYSFSGRAKRWQDMLDKAEKEERMRHTMPRVNRNAIRRDNYFHEDMQKNRGW